MSKATSMLNADIPVESKQLNLKGFLRSASHFVGASYFARALGAVRGFVNARWLGPEFYGLCGTIAFFVSFGFHLHAGAQDMMLRRIPTYRSRGRDDLAEHTAQITFSFFSVMLFFGALILWAAGIFSPAGTLPVIRIGLFVAGIAMILEVLFEFERNVTRSEERFNRVNHSLLISSVISLFLTLWLVTRYGIYGFYFTAIVTPAIGLAYLRRYARYSWRFKWSFREVRVMIKTGWPVLMMTLVFEALGWIDRFLVIGVLGMKHFGYYGLGVMLLQLCFIFPTVISLVIEPKLFGDYAKNKNASDVQEHLWIPLKMQSYLLPFGLVILDLILPDFVRLLLPEYVPGINAMRIIVWGCVWMGLLMNLKTYIVATRRQRDVLPLYVFAIVLNLIFSVSFLSLGWGLVGIALGTTLSYIVAASALLYFVSRTLDETKVGSVYKVIKLYLPTIVMVFVTILLPNLMLRDAGFPLLGLRFGLILTCFIGFFFFIKRRYQLQIAGVFHG